MFGWLRRAPWGNPAFSGMALSVIMFGFIGGISGVVLGTEQLNVLMHNTIYVPGHFHGTVVVVEVIGQDGQGQLRSEALAADALHFSSDLVNSGLVLLALAAAAFGYPQADPLVAIGVALFIDSAIVRRLAKLCSARQV